MAKTHPHLDHPTNEQLSELVADLPGERAATYLALHQLILDTLPDIAYSVDQVDLVIGYGAKQYGYGGWGMLAVSPYTKWVSLTWMQGARLADPDAVLTGTSAMRHVKPTSPDEVAQLKPALVPLLQAAAHLND